MPLGSVRMPVQVAIRWLAFACVIALGLFVAPIAHGAEPEPALHSLKQIPELPDKDLAFGFLAAHEQLVSGLGAIHATWAELRAKGQNAFADSAVGIVNMPDGTTQQHKFTEFAELDRFIGKIRERYAAYAAEITKRGFEPTAAKFKANVSKECAANWILSGDASSQSDQFFFVLQQGDQAFWGATVKNTAVIIYPGGLRPPLIGNIEAGRIRFQEHNGQCNIELVGQK